MSKATFSSALERLSRYELGVRSTINIGAGTGLDTPFVERIWPGSRTLLIDMDARFEPGWMDLKRKHPGVCWAVCGAAARDGDGFMDKTNDVGGAVSDAAQSGSKAIVFRKIDTLVADHGLDGPFFMRFDTHGVELDILAGAEQTLSRTVAIQMECYNFRLKFVGGRNLLFDEMTAHMRGLGFRCADLFDPLFRSDGALWQMHLLFLREDHTLFQRTGFSG